YFRAPGALDDLGFLLSKVEMAAPAATRRVADAMGRNPAAPAPPAPAGETRVEVDAVMTWSDREILNTRACEQTTAEELRRARAAIARLALPLAEVPTRRFRPAPRGRVDLRATLRASARGDLALRWRTRRVRPPPIVCLCDISGSM